jgi:hypothetical protein
MQITLTLPEDISDQIQQIADATGEPVEHILIEHIKTLSLISTLPVDEQEELEAFRHLSSDTLKTIARELMPQAVQLRAQELMDKNSHGTITDEEHQELEKLAERGDRLMLRKAEAASILNERGETFTQSDFKP